MKNQIITIKDRAIAETVNRNVTEIPAYELEKGVDVAIAFQLLNIGEEKSKLYKARVIANFADGDKWKTDKNADGIACKSFSAWCTKYTGLSDKSVSLYKQAGEKVTADGFHSIYYEIYRNRWNDFDLGYTQIARLCPAGDFIRPLLDGNFVNPATSGNNVQAIVKVVTDNKEKLEQAVERGEFDSFLKSLLAAAEKAKKAKKAQPKDETKDNLETPANATEEPENNEKEDVNIITAKELCVLLKGRTLKVVVDGKKYIVAF